MCTVNKPAKWEKQQFVIAWWLESLCTAKASERQYAQLMKEVEAGQRELDLLDVRPCAAWLHLYPVDCVIYFIYSNFFLSFFLSLSLSFSCPRSLISLWTQTICRRRLSRCALTPRMRQLWSSVNWSSRPAAQPFVILLMSRSSTENETNRNETK